MITRLFFERLLVYNKPLSKLSGKQVSQVDDMHKPFIDQTPDQEGMRYRLAGQGGFFPCTAVTVDSSDLSFHGSLPVETGKAVEIFLVPENALYPPLTAYVEINGCEREGFEGFRISATIRGIKSD